jgi:hypothetical protein
MSKETNTYEGEGVVPRLERENDEKSCHKRNQGRKRVSLQGWELRKEDGSTLRCTDTGNELEKTFEEVENEEAEAELPGRLAQKHTNRLRLSPFMGDTERVVCSEIPPNPTNAKKYVGQVGQVSDESAPVVGDRGVAVVRAFRPFLI